MASSALYRRWFRGKWPSGDPVAGLIAFDPVTVIFPTTVTRVTIERTRLAVQCYNFSSAEDYYPSPVNPHQGLHAYVSCAPAETGSYPPPFNWPDIEDSEAHKSARPVLHGALRSDYVVNILNTDPLAGFQGVGWSASLMMEEADSSAQRTFYDTYIATAWLCVSNLGLAGEGPDYIPGYRCVAMLDVLAAGYAF